MMGRVYTRRPRHIEESQLVRVWVVLSAELALLAVVHTRAMTQGHHQPETLRQVGGEYLLGPTLSLAFAPRLTTNLICHTYLFVTKLRRSPNGISSIIMIGTESLTVGRKKLCTTLGCTSRSIRSCNQWSGPRQLLISGVPCAPLSRPPIQCHASVLSLFPSTAVL